MRKMKDSGIEWIGQIPKEWNIIRTKYLCDLYTGNSIKDEDKDNFKDPIDAHSYIATKDIDAQFCTADYDNGIYIKNKDSSFKIAPTGSALMCIEGGSAGKKKALVTQPVSFVNKLCCFSAVSANNRYVYYYISSPHYEEQFKTSMSGLIGGVSVSTLKNIPISIPESNNQSRIADFLEDKCSKIDRYIEKQQQIIEKLKAYKQSVITEAVTKGLDHNVPMKASGIEWIGEIPEHWGIGKIGYVTKKIGSGKTPKGGSEVYVSEGILFLRSQNVYDYGLVLDDPIFITEKIDNEMNNTRVYKNDVLLNITGGSIGRSCIYTFDKHANVNQHVCIIRVINTTILPKYMNYFWMSHAGQTSIDIHQTGANREGLNFEQISKTILPIPNIEEQNAIVSFLDEKCTIINNFIKDVNVTIDKLTEYKKSLIYEAVTGKIFK